MTSAGLSTTDVIKELKMRGIFTPDLKSEVEKFNFHLVFVYDNFKVGFPGENVLVHCPYLGIAATVENDFVMRKTPGSPIIYQVGEDEKRKQFAWAAPVLGQVYAMTPWQLIKMDGMMDNTGTYQRTRKYVAFHNQESPFKDRITFPTQFAWVYMPTPFFLEQLKYTQTISANQTRKKINSYEKLFWEWRKSDLPN